jgi:dinuclear metal center YbgI/SA1388 family protein
MSENTAFTVRNACRVLDQLAPLHLAEDWDQVGLQIGDYDAAASKALVCIDYTPAVFEEAKAKGCDFVVAYHPPMFKALSRLTTGCRWEPGPDRGAWKQDLLVKTVREGVSVYSPHTALDAVRGGFCDMLCDVVADGADYVARALKPHVQTVRQYKVVTFVPEADAERVRRAMHDAGAGELGAYRECSFTGPGTGRFRPLAGASPAIGESGRLETVDEMRIEVQVPVGWLEQVVAALREAHPYEVPALDVIQLEADPSPIDPRPGAGRYFMLAEPITAETLASRFASFSGATPKLGGRRDTPIQMVTVCPGAGGALFDDEPSDAYITGEMQHHQVLDLVQRGSVVLLLGHTASERPLLPRYVQMIRATDAGQIDWLISEADVTPWEMR